MKTFVTFVIAAVSAQLVSGHYTFPDITANGVASADWQYVRITANHYSQSPVTDVKDQAIRCYELDYAASPGQTGTATVTAGSTFTFKADQSIYHPGYFSAYMSPASPAANSASAGLGSTWFKIWEWAPTYSKSTGLVFASQNVAQFSFTIPKSVPNGQYLIRGEQIAIHSASSYGGAQFYIACAQVNVVGGGSGKPSPTVAFPGAYTGYEPGILINMYSLPANYTGYTSPGPAVWQG